MSELSIGRARADIRIMGLVGTAHFTSHFFHLVLPPLFPAIHEAMGLSFGQLGFVITVFFSASALGQIVAGFVVDRIGPEMVLPTGMALLSGAVAGMGFLPNYATFLVLAMFGGLGNSVYHPADYSVLTGRISPSRIARAYSVHTISGTIGWAVAPVTVLFLSEYVGWRSALIVVGIVGLIIAGLVASVRADLCLPPQAKMHGLAKAGSPLPRLLSAPILLAFVYFMLLAIALGGTQNFMPTMLPRVQNISVAGATAMLTAYLVANAIGSLAGGLIADMTRHHDRIVGAGLAGAAALVLAMGFWQVTIVPLLMISIGAGFLVGATIPSRDMLVRAATPPGATGKVFGFVYSGLDLGSLIAPVVIGSLLDRNLDRMPFVFIAAALAITIVSAFRVRPARI